MRDYLYLLETAHERIENSDMDLTGILGVHMIYETRQIGFIIQHAISPCEHFVAIQQYYEKKFMLLANAQERRSDDIRPNGLHSEPMRNDQPRSVR